MHRALPALALLLAPGPAEAGLLGTQATVRYAITHGLLADKTTDVVIVGPGIEIACPGAFELCTALSLETETIDLGNTTIRYEYRGGLSGFRPGEFSGFLFEDLNPGAPIIGVTFTTDIVGIDASRISFTADSITLPLAEVLLPGPINFFELGLVLGTVEVPAPSAILPFGLGLLGLGLARRRIR